MTENITTDVQTAPAPVKSKKTHSKKTQKLIADIITYIVLLIGTFIMLYPFWWMLAASFTADKMEIMEDLVWWPSKDATTHAVFGNWFALYARIFESGGSVSKLMGSNKTVWTAIANTLIYSIVPVVVGVLTSASAAFAFSKIEWIGRNVVFMVLLSAVMIPGPSIMIIQYCMYSLWKWNSGKTGWMVHVIPGMFGSIMTAFFVRQFLYGMPTSIIEAAKIDGAGYWRIFWGFIVPLAMPAIMAQGLLSFMGCWNNYMGVWIMSSMNSEWWNLPVLISQIQSTVSLQSDNYGLTFAASVASIIPVLILFAVFQKQIIGSLMLTGSKE